MGVKVKVNLLDNISKELGSGEYNVEQINSMQDYQKYIFEQAIYQRNL